MAETAIKLTQVRIKSKDGSDVSDYNLIIDLEKTVKAGAEGAATEYDLELATDSDIETIFS